MADLRIWTIGRTFAHSFALGILLAVYSAAQSPPVQSPPVQFPPVPSPPVQSLPAQSLPAQTTPAWPLLPARHATRPALSPSFSAPSGSLPPAAADVLRQMASVAAVIFAGEVTAVSRNDAEGFIDIRFRIDQPVRGCPQTGAYVLREWSGLWSAHPDRYRVGDRRLMLLPLRGSSGMSSPIGGMDGAIPIVASGVEPIANAAGEAPGDDGTAPQTAVDLRWIQARALRTPILSGVEARARAASTAVGPLDPDDAWVGPISPLHASSPLNASSSVNANGPLSANPASTASSSTAASLNVVLSLLGGSPGGSSAQR